MSETTTRADRAGTGAIEIPARPGIVATSHPLAVRAALDVLRGGGNAVDAAVTAALVLGVVDPMSTGLGGDAFALVWDGTARVLRGLNGSGRAPGRATIEDLVRRGHRSMPERGILSATVPGALGAFEALLVAHGTRTLAACIEPAAAIADDGFAVTPVVARDWAAAEAELRRGSGTEAWLVGGRAPREGETFRAPDLGRTLRRIARDGAADLYRGALASEIAACSAAHDGWLDGGDLAAYEPEWVTPLEGTYRGVSIFELPPNGQGVAVLEALALLDGLPMPDMPAADRAHFTIEAVKLAMADAAAWVGDPAHAPHPAHALLDDGYVRSRRALLGERAAAAPSAGAPGGDTVYVAVVDAHGNACSLIHSIYAHFGSGVVVPGTGLTLQNRGALFSVDAAHPAALGPRRRPYHTIIPAMAFRGEQPWLVLGVVGGFQQPQAQVQLLTRLVDLVETPDEAVRAPRFRWTGGATVRLEAGTDADVAQRLVARGHDVARDASGGFGGAQVIEIDPMTGALRGASDPRKDGEVGRT